MELVTLSFIAVPVAVAAAVAILVKRNTIVTESEAAELARARALKRAEERAFCDTTPAHDPYRTGIEFINSTVVDDAYDSHGVPLNDEQINTINSIFAGMYSTPVHRPVCVTGGSVNAKAGVPVGETAFDDLNMTDTKSGPEYLDPDYKWPSTYPNDR